MIVVRFKVQCQPEKTEQAKAAFEEIDGEGNHRQRLSVRW